MNHCIKQRAKQEKSEQAGRPWQRSPRRRASQHGLGVRVFGWDKTWQRVFAGLPMGLLRVFFSGSTAHFSRAVSPLGRAAGANARASWRRPLTGRRRAAIAPTPGNGPYPPTAVVPPTGCCTTTTTAAVCERLAAAAMIRQASFDTCRPCHNILVSASRPPRGSGLVSFAFQIDCFGACQMTRDSLVWTLAPQAFLPSSIHGHWTSQG